MQCYYCGNVTNCHHTSPPLRITNNGNGTTTVEVGAQQTITLPRAATVTLPKMTRIIVCTKGQLIEAGEDFDAFDHLKLGEDGKLYKVNPVKHVIGDE